MVNIELDRTYPVSATTLWTRIYDFHDLSWLPAVAETRRHADESSRVAVLPDGAGEVVERLLDEGDRFQSYELTDPGPMPVSDYTSTLRVEEVDVASCRVVWQASFEPAGIPAAVAEAAVAGVFTGGLDHLATVV